MESENIIHPPDFDHIVYIASNNEILNGNNGMVNTKNRAIANWRKNKDKNYNYTYNIPETMPDGRIRIAVCISGFMRDYKRLLQDKHFTNLIKEFNIDVYISTWNLVGLGSCTDHSLDLSNFINENSLRNFPCLKQLDVEIYNRVQKQKHFDIKIPNTVVLKNEPDTLPRFRSQFYKVNRCHQMVLDSKIKYQVVMRMRSDLLFPEKIKINKMLPDIRNHTVFLSIDPCGREMHGICGDQVAIGNLYTMTIYCNLFNELYRETFLRKNIPMTCERIVTEHLRCYNIQYIANIATVINRTTSTPAQLEQVRIAQEERTKRQMKRKQEKQLMMNSDTDTDTFVNETTVPSVNENVLKINEDVKKKTKMIQNFLANRTVRINGIIKTQQPNQRQIKQRISNTSFGAI